MAATPTLQTIGEVYAALSDQDYQHLISRNKDGSSKYKIAPATTNSTGCWLSSKAPDKERGYIKTKVPFMRPNGSSKHEPYLHVLAFFSACSSPQREGIRLLMERNGEQISHLCHNKTCFNPDHLVRESAAQNRSRNDCRSFKKVKCPNCAHEWCPCPHEIPCILDWVCCTHQHLVCELHPVKNKHLLYPKICFPSFFVYFFTTDLAADYPLFHLSRFYHTRGHYPGHKVCFHPYLVDIALGFSRNLTVLHSPKTTLAYSFERLGL